MREETHTIVKELVEGEKTQSRKQKQTKEEMKTKQFQSYYLVVKLYPQRYSGWTVVTVVFPCSSNRNLQGWSSNKIRALNIRYTIWRTYTIRLAVALLAEHRHSIPVCFRDFLLPGMLMSYQRWSSCCTLLDGKHNNRMQEGRQRGAVGIR